MDFAGNNHPFTPLSAPAMVARTIRSSAQVGRDRWARWLPPARGTDRRRPRHRCAGRRAARADTPAGHSLDVPLQPPAVENAQTGPAVVRGELIMPGGDRGVGGEQAVAPDPLEGSFAIVRSLRHFLEEQLEPVRALALIHKPSGPKNARRQSGFVCPRQRSLMLRLPRRFIPFSPLSLKGKDDL